MKAAATQPAAFEVINMLDLLPRVGEWPQRPLEGITDITMHHSCGSLRETVEYMARVHISAKKYPGIAYHFVICPDGRTLQCNPVRACTLHNGFNNEAALGICLIGNFEKAPPTPAQITAAQHLCLALKCELPALLYCTGHGEYKGHLVCPGRLFPLAAFRDMVGLPVSPAAGKVRIR